MKGFDVACHPRLGREPTAALGTLVVCLLMRLHMHVQGQAVIEHFLALITPE